MTITKRHKSTIIFIVLCIAFLVFSVTIYIKPANIEKYDKKEVAKASEGRIIWQKYNCHVCHQLYGLGGYLGPDLTNVYKKYEGNSAVLSHLLKGGMKQMPVFNLSKEEEDLLITFLKSTNESGISDPRNFKKLSNGMIEHYGKH